MVSFHWLWKQFCQDFCTLGVAKMGEMRRQKCYSCSRQSGFYALLLSWSLKRKLRSKEVDWRSWTRPLDSVLRLVSSLIGSRQGLPLLLSFTLGHSLSYTITNESSAVRTQLVVLSSWKQPSSFYTPGQEIPCFWGSGRQDGFAGIFLMGFTLDVQLLAVSLNPTFSYTPFPYLGCDSTGVALLWGTLEGACEAGGERKD